MKNGPILRGFLSPISGMFLYGEAPYRSKPSSPVPPPRGGAVASGRKEPRAPPPTQASRQGARAQLHRQLLGRHYREIAAHLPRAAEDRLAVTDADNSHVVEHNGERPADVLGRDAPALLKRKVMTGSLAR